MLSCNLYNNYFFNWSAFWSTFQKLTIALTHKNFGGAGRPDSALHLKPFCRNCVWSVLALAIAGSITLGVWKSVHKDVCSAMFTFQILLGNDMMDDCSFFLFFHPLLAKGFPGTWDMSLPKKITQHLQRTKDSRRLYSVSCSFTWTPAVSGCMWSTKHLVQVKSRLLVKPKLILVTPVVCISWLNNFSLIQLLTERRRVWAENQQFGGQ